jgi:1,2-diacylglycerol 3-beta-glucosyltransferase
VSLLQVQTLTLALLLLWPAHNLLVAAIGMRATRPATPAAGKDDSGAPCHFWLIIPALNEERVIAQTVASALALHAAGTPARVLVVDDASDDATPHALAQIRNPRLSVLRRELPDARRGKGEALNAAYRWIAANTPADHTERTIIGIIDGDGRIAPGGLATIAAYFAEASVGAVQCQVRIHNRHRLLALLQDIEFGCIAHASQGLRDRLGSVGLGGNGQFTRLSVLAGFGDQPWSSCLVEDLELGLRLHLAGIRIRYASTVAVTQQGLVDSGRLLRQRTRWAHGNLQCARHLTRLAGSREVGSVGLIDFLQYLIAPWLTVPVSALVLALATTTLAAFGAGYPVPGLVADHTNATQALVTWGAVLLIPGMLWALTYWARFRDEPLARCLSAGLAYPAFLLLGVLATWRALYRHARGDTTWAKTERQLDTTPASCTTDHNNEAATPTPLAPILDDPTARMATPLIALHPRPAVHQPTTIDFPAPPTTPVEVPSPRPELPLTFSRLHGHRPPGDGRLSEPPPHKGRFRALQPDPDPDQPTPGSTG